MLNYQNFKFLMIFFFYCKNYFYFPDGHFFRAVQFIFMQYHSRIFGTIKKSQTTSILTDIHINIYYVI